MKMIAGVFKKNKRVQKPESLSVCSVRWPLHTYGHTLMFHLQWTWKTRVVLGSFKILFIRYIKRQTLHWHIGLCGHSICDLLCYLAVLHSSVFKLYIFFLKWKKYWFVLTDHSLRYYKDSIAEEVGLFVLFHTLCFYFLLPLKYVFVSV